MFFAAFFIFGGQTPSEKKGTLGDHMGGSGARPGGGTPGFHFSGCHTVMWTLLEVRGFLFKEPSLSVA